MKRIQKNSALQPNDALSELRSVPVTYHFQNPLKEFLERGNALQLNNPSKEISDGISVQLQEHVRKIQETVNTQIQESLKQSRNAINAFQLHDPLKEFRETVSALQSNNPFKQISDGISIQLHEPMRRVQEAINAQIQESLEQFRNGVNAAWLRDQAKAPREKVDALYFRDPFKQANEAINALQFNGPLMLVLERLRTFPSSGIVNAVATVESLVHDINTNDGNFVTLGTATFDSAEIQSIATQIVQTALSRPEDQLAQTISETIVAEIRAQKDGPVKQFLIFFIYPLLVGIVLLAIESHVKDWLGADKRKSEKQIKKQVLSTAQDAAHLDSYRLVCATTLAVRLKPSAKSALLGRFSFGQVVVLIEKRGDWSLVTWANDTKGLALQGWVFSRYLSKFR